MSMQLYPGYSFQNYCEDPYVQLIQVNLRSGGYAVGPIDSKFGPDTESAVRNYQTNNGLVCDGIVGPNTWNSLC